MATMVSVRSSEVRMVQKKTIQSRITRRGQNKVLIELRRRRDVEQGERMMCPADASMLPKRRGEVMFAVAKSRLFIMM